MKKLLLSLFMCLAFSVSCFAAVNLNTATKEELESVTGIGPVKAQAILDYRKNNGPFRKVDDLKQVAGFGDKSVVKMRSEVTVGDEAETPIIRRSSK